MAQRKKTHPVAVKRKAAGLSGSDLARLVRISPSHLGDIESGRIGSPSVDVALRLAAVLGTTVNTLFGARRRRAA